MTLRLDKILDLFINIFSFLIVFLIPLFFPYFFITNNLFELTKFILFKILVLLWSFVFFIKLIIDNDFYNKKIQILKKIYLKNKIDIIFFFLFILSLIFSTYLAFDKNLSIYGLYDRQFGLIFYFYCLLFFGLFVLSIKKSYIVYYVKLILTSSFFVCIYALAQISGYDFMNWSEKWGAVQRATSTFGQPNFLASYLLLVIPITIYFIYISNKFLGKFFGLIVLVLQLLTLYFTYSRGGWIGLIFGLLVFGIIYWILQIQILRAEDGYSNSKNNRNLLHNNKYYKFGLIFIILVIILIIFSIDHSKIFSRRITSLLDFQSGSVAVRISFWQASWDAIKQRPLFGYGLDNQGEVLIKYYQKDWGIFNNVNSYPNRAHNLFLDILLTRGIFGLVTYLVLLYLFFRTIFKNIKENKARELNLAILAATICYLVSLQFSFSFIVSEIYFWLYFAIIYILGVRRMSH